MDKASNNITTTDTTIALMPVIDIEGWGEVLLFPSAQVLWNFQAAQTFRDTDAQGEYYEDLVYGERAYNTLRDEFGFDADEAMDWIASGEFAWTQPNSDNIIIGAK